MALLNLFVGDAEGFLQPLDQCLLLVFFGSAEVVGEGLCTRNTAVGLRGQASHAGTEHTHTQM